MKFYLSDDFFIFIFHFTEFVLSHQRISMTLIHSIEKDKYLSQGYIFITVMNFIMLILFSTVMIFMLLENLYFMGNLYHINDFSY